MYPDKYAVTHPDRAAFIMASTGEEVSYAEFEGRSNRLAQLLRAAGLGIEDHYSVFMENNARYLEACAAGERAGLYYLHQLISYGRRSRIHYSKFRVPSTHY